MAYRRLSPEQRDEVRRLLAEGKLSLREIASRTGVSLRTVQRERESMQAWAGAVPAEALPSAEELPGLEAPAPEGQPAPTPEPCPGEASAALPEAPADVLELPIVEPQEETAPVAPVVAPERERPLLERLLEELREHPEGVRALREAIMPELAPADRLPKGPRRTMAFYISEELGRLIRAQARRLDVAPSVVVEQILWRAKAAGWLG